MTRVRHGGHWLRRQVENTGLSQAAFCSKAEIAYPTLRMWFGQERPSIRPEKLVRLAQALGKSREEMEENLNVGGRAARVPDLVRIPIINRIAAGEMREFTDLGYPGGFADEYIELPVGEIPAFAMRVDGHSMWPKYEHGDLVVFRAIDPEKTPIINGRDYAVQLDGLGDGESTFKRLSVDARRPSIVKAKSLNPKSKSANCEIRRERIIRLGLVIMVIPAYAAVGRSAKL